MTGEKLSSPDEGSTTPEQGPPAAEEGPPQTTPSFVWETPASAAAAGTPPPGRVMTSGDIFDRALWVYRRGFVILVAVAAVVQIPLALVEGIIGQRLESTVAAFSRLNGTQPTPEELTALFQDAFPALIAASLTIGLVSFIAGLLLSPALIVTIARIHHGERASVGDAYRAALRSAPAILVGSIVIGLAAAGLFAAIVVAGILVVVVSRDSGVAVFAILATFILSLFAVIYVTVRWAVWSQAVVLERRGPLDALGRSWQLVKGSMWRTLGITVVVGIVAGLAGAILGIIGGAVSSGLPVGWRGVLPTVLGIFTVSWLPIVTTLLFLDLRARREAPAAVTSIPPEASWPIAPG
jgi:hypothetical protein